MTNSPQTPPPSPDDQQIRSQIRHRVRQETMDEWIAILVSFGTIGAILFWTLGLRKSDFLLTQSGESLGGATTVLEDTPDIEAFVTPDRLDSDTELRILEDDERTSSGLSFLEDDLYRTESGGRALLGDSSVATVPSIGAVTPTTVPGTAVPETELESEIETEIETELETTVPEAEAEVDIETEAGDPDVEAEVEVETETETETETATTPTEPENVVAFADVPEEYWAYPFLQKLGEQELIAPTSDNQFEPDDLITRAGMATLISQAFDQPRTNDTKNFKDIDDGNIIAEDIDKAVRTGFMKGYSEDEFRPAENIPRYQVLVALATGLGLEPSGDPLFILQNFSDRDKIPDWAISQVAAATEAGLAVNRPDFDLQSLRPEEPATRAEVAAMIYQTLQQSGKVEAIDSEYIVPKP